jgi:hypothetical protein
MPVSFVAFSWTPFKDTTEYRFVLAKDSALTDIIVQENLPTTAYKYNGRLDYDTCYFWQVKASKPVPGEPSPVFSFTTIARPAPESTPPPPYQQILHWLQACILIIVLMSAVIAGLIILSIKRRT